MKKPLKSMVFTSGHAEEGFLAEVGPISEFVLTPVSWVAPMRFQTDSSDFKKGSLSITEGVKACVTPDVGQWLMRRNVGINSQTIRDFIKLWESNPAYDPVTVKYPQIQETHTVCSQPVYQADPEKSFFGVRQGTEELILEFVCSLSQAFKAHRSILHGHIPPVLSMSEVQALCLLLLLLLLLLLPLLRCLSSGRFDEAHGLVWPLLVAGADRINCFSKFVQFVRHQAVSNRDSFFGSAQDYAVSYQSEMKKLPTHIAAGASASGYLLMLALQGAFTKCDIGATAGDPTNLLYGSSGNISCADNLNDGFERLRERLELMQVQTFFGQILFNSFRQNFAGEVKVLQAQKKIRDLKEILSPAVVLPLKLATASLKLPQPNRYEPVCPPGGYQNPDPFEPCIKCDKGHFQDKAGASRCMRCFKNFYTNSTGAKACDRCPANSETAVRGATAITQCTCKPGFFTRYGRPGTPCEPCPAHATCAGDNDVPRNDPGWHAEPDQPWQMYDCNPGTPCTGNFTCQTGYTGRMCADCEPGYFVAFERCLPCVGEAANIIIMLLVYVLFIIVVVGLSRNMEIIHLLMNFCEYSVLQSLGFEMQTLAAAETLPKAAAETSQTLSILALFNLRWPVPIEIIFNVAGVLSFEMDLIQPQCVTEWGFAENLYIQLAWPVFLLIMMFTWTSVTQAAFRMKLKLNGKSLDDFGSSSFQTSFSSQKSGSFSTSKLLGGSSLGGSSAALSLDTSKWYTILQKNVMDSVRYHPIEWTFARRLKREGSPSDHWMLAYTGAEEVGIRRAVFYVPSSPQEMHELWLERMSIPLMALNLGYVVILKYCLTAFSCRDFMGTLYLSYEPGTMCYTADHYKLMLVAAAGLVVYVGGTWFMFGHVMYNLKKTGSFVLFNVLPYMRITAQDAHCIAAHVQYMRITAQGAHCVAVHVHHSIRRN
ncbi:hypothetical protein DUNSADRAFT_6742 [Dunaliella salina]|uniref:Tyrosine-protein kinase ephrin type A/B receptor-like domain-containing protein n=1 Tax=Dunaliella salina TaxID=3046 RepID=A0ABQ7H6K5_DUNSA|nr:hypothetical protein DUNSADRAFT_6742 [Dunaliella salina]|eukprot:KAF5842498.1 hypothetical protein DUNSADRAFT_6742 [Dunaliella salina]